MREYFAQTAQTFFYYRYSLGLHDALVKNEILLLDVAMESGIYMSRLSAGHFSYRCRSGSENLARIGEATFSSEDIAHYMSRYAIRAVGTTINGKFEIRNVSLASAIALQSCRIIGKASLENVRFTSMGCHLPHDTCGFFHLHFRDVHIGSDIQIDFRSLDARQWLKALNDRVKAKECLLKVQCLRNQVDPKRVGSKHGPAWPSLGSQGQGQGPWRGVPEFWLVSEQATVVHNKSSFPYAIRTESEILRASRPNADQRTGTLFHSSSSDERGDAEGHLPATTYASVIFQNVTVNGRAGLCAHSEGSQSDNQLLPMRVLMDGVQVRESFTPSIDDSGKRINGQLTALGYTAITGLLSGLLLGAAGTLDQLLLLILGATIFACFCIRMFLAVDTKGTVHVLLISLLFLATAYTAVIYRPTHTVDLGSVWVPLGFSLLQSGFVALSWFSCFAESIIHVDSQSSRLSWSRKPLVRIRDIIGWQEFASYVRRAHRCVYAFWIILFALFVILQPWVSVGLSSSHSAQNVSAVLGLMGWIAVAFSGLYIGKNAIYLENRLQDHGCCVFYEVRSSTVGALDTSQIKPLDESWRIESGLDVPYRNMPELLGGDNCAGILAHCAGWISSLTLIGWDRSSHTGAPEQRAILVLSLSVVGLALVCLVNSARKSSPEGERVRRIVTFLNRCSFDLRFYRSIVGAEDRANRHDAAASVDSYVREVEYATQRADWRTVGHYFVSRVTGHGRRLWPSFSWFLMLMLWCTVIFAQPGATSSVGGTSDSSVIDFSGLQQSPGEALSYSKSAVLSLRFLLPFSIIPVLQEYRPSDRPIALPDCLHETGLGYWLTSFEWKIHYFNLAIIVSVVGWVMLPLVLGSVIAVVLGRAKGEEQA